MNDEFSEWTLVAEISNDFELGALLSELNAQNLSYRLHRTETCIELWVEFSDQVPEVLKILEGIQKQQEQLISMVAQLEHLLKEKEIGVARQQTQIDLLKQKLNSFILLEAIGNVFNAT